MYDKINHTIANFIVTVNWFENTDGQGSFGSKQTISTYQVKNIFAADFDGDGTFNVWEISEDGTPKEVIKD